jgi:hypothetical protein
MKHPTNHLERIKIKQRKDEKRIQEKVNTGRLWRAYKERDKERTLEDELRHPDDY